MFAQLRSVVLMFVVLTLITGVAYPLLVTVIAQTVFPYQANGSLIVRDGKLVGSELIGQSFDDPKYFWGRPSATSAFPDDASGSSGSNLGPTNPAQFDAVRGRTRRDQESTTRQHRPGADRLRDRLGQRPRSAKSARPPPSTKSIAWPKCVTFPVEQVRKLVAQNTEDRTFGLLGEPRVNVLKLNLALDDFKSAK